MKFVFEPGIRLLLVALAFGQGTVQSSAQKVEPPQPSPEQKNELTIWPVLLRLSAGNQRQFTATLNGAANAKVSWTVSGEGCTGDTCGTISANGLYTAPIQLPNPPIVKITAVAHAQPELTTSATVTLVPLRVSAGVTPPRPIYTPDPEYSSEARNAKFEGTCVLWMIVGSDGRPRGIRLAKSLGMGLDEKAIEAVKQWTFQPATKDGKPVAFQINVEVRFRLQHGAGTEPDSHSKPN